MDSINNPALLPLLGLARARIPRAPHELRERTGPAADGRRCLQPALRRRGKGRPWVRPWSDLPSGPPRYVLRGCLGFSERNKNSNAAGKLWYNLHLASGAHPGIGASRGTPPSMAEVTAALQRWGPHILYVRGGPGVRTFVCTRPVRQGKSWCRDRTLTLSGACQGRSCCRERPIRSRALSAAPGWSEKQFCLT